MYNDNHLDYKGNRRIEIDKQFNYRPHSRNNLDDVADDLDGFVILTLRQGGKVIIWTTIAVGVYYVVNPLIVGVMSATEDVVTATSRTVRATTTLTNDVGIFLGEVAYPLFVGAIIFCFLKVVRHA